MHEKARSALVSRLLDCLRAAEFHDGSFSTYRNDFDGVQEQVLKYRGDWLEKYDVDDVISDVVVRRLPSEAQKQSGSLLDWLGDQALVDIATEIVTFLESLPRPYRVLFPMPRIEISREIKLSESISLIRTPEGKLSVISQLAVPGPRPSTTYLSVIGHGYFRSNLNQSAMRDAMGLMKRVVQVGVVKEAFERDRFANPGQMLADMLGSPAERIHQAIVYDVLDKEKATAVVRLRLGTSSYLDTLCIHDDSKPHLTITIPVISSKNRDQDLERLVAFPVSLMTSAKTEENTKSLRSALEWAFDAAADDEPVAGFIKTCIALEAALGEESEGDQITERLADRCAFLLNKTPIDRARTRRLMKDVYKLRSKLVHGVTNKFASKDRELNIWASVHLSLVLSSEIDAVENWWRDREQGSR